MWRLKFHQRSEETIIKQYSYVSTRGISFEMPLNYCVNRLKYGYYVGFWIFSCYDYEYVLILGRSKISVS